MNEFNTEAGRDWIVSHLKMGPVKVTFTKKDGSERVMSCTLKSDLTEDYEKKTEKTKQANPDVCPVYDLDVKAWRSFRFDSVKKVSFEV
jgi:hypothetical protein